MQHGLLHWQPFRNAEKDEGDERLPRSIEESRRRLVDAKRGRNERPFKRNERPLSKSPIGGRACHTASQRPSLLPLPVPSLGSPYVGSGFGEVEAPNGVPQSGHISALLVFVTVFASWHLVQKKTIWSGQLIPPDAWSRSSSSSSIPLSEKQAASFSSSIMIESPPFRSHCGTFLFRNPHIPLDYRSNRRQRAIP